MRKFVVEVDKERCKGCELCVEFCPTGVLTVSPDINQKGYHPSLPSHPEKCIGCLFCVLVCPDVAINVFKEEPIEVEAKNL